MGLSGALDTPPRSYQPHNPSHTQFPDSGPALPSGQGIASDRNSVSLYVHERIQTAPAKTFVKHFEASVAAAAQALGMGSNYILPVAVPANVSGKELSRSSPPRTMAP